MHNILLSFDQERLAAQYNLNLFFLQWLLIRYWSNETLFVSVFIKDWDRP